MEGRMRNIFSDNLMGILVTIIFHLVLVIIFLSFRIESIQNQINDIITIDLEGPKISEPDIDPPATQDGQIDQYVAEYLKSERTNMPVNIATNLDEQISTERFVNEFTNELFSNRSEEMINSEERLRELEDMEAEASNVTMEDSSRIIQPFIFTGKTNIFYSLKDRYHLRLPVPVYKCEGSGIVEVHIVVDQKGYIESVQIPDLGESVNEICLAEAAKTAALNTRFNSNFKAPSRQEGTITYYFQPQ